MIDSETLELAAMVSAETKALATTKIAMRAIGHTNSQMLAPRFRFQTIQFFFIKAPKCLNFYPIKKSPY